MTEGQFNEGTKPRDRFEAEFAALPLGEKFAKLFRMEMSAMSEAINYAVKEPMKVVENVGDALNRVGDRIESEFRNATCRPNYEAPPAAPDFEPGHPPPPHTPKKPRPPRSAKP